MARKLTAQAAFNKSARHLLKQGKKSGLSKPWGYQCLYRGPNGTSCAVGALIPKRIEPDECSVSALPYVCPEVIEAWGGIGAFNAMEELLCELQDVHDSYPPSRWRAKLRAVAKRFNLSPAVLGAAP